VPARRAQCFRGFTSAGCPLWATDRYSGYACAICAARDELWACRRGTRLSMRCVERAVTRATAELPDVRKIDHLRLNVWSRRRSGLLLRCQPYEVRSARRSLEQRQRERAPSSLCRFGSFARSSARRPRGSCDLSVENRLRAAASAFVFAIACSRDRSASACVPNRLKRDADLCQLTRSGTAWDSCRSGTLSFLIMCMPMCFELRHDAVERREVTRFRCARAPSR